MLAAVAFGVIYLLAVSVVNAVGIVGGAFSAKRSSTVGVSFATLSLMYSSGRFESTFHALPTPTHHHFPIGRTGIVAKTFCPKS